MDVSVATIRSDGRAPKAGGPGCGFLLLPYAVPVESSSYSADVRPGSYPAAVRFTGGGPAQELPVLGPHAVCVPGAPFRGFDLVGRAGESWLVVVLADPSERYDVAAKSRTPQRMQAAAAVPTASPSLSTDGVEVRPGLSTLTFYAGGTLGLARLWVRTLGGTWVDTLEDLDFAASAVQVRSVYQPGGRVYLKAAAGGLTMEIDGEWSLG